MIKEKSAVSKAKVEKIRQAMRKFWVLKSSCVSKIRVSFYSKTIKSNSKMSDLLKLSLISVSYSNLAFLNSKSQRVLVLNSIFCIIEFF